MTTDFNSLSKSAQNFQEVLARAGKSFKVIELPESTHTAQQAADAIGCSIQQIVKSLIFKIIESNEPILILVSGPNRVNEKAIETLIGKKIMKADADFTREVTGFAIGGIPPIGHAQPIRSFIDKDLLKLKELWAAAGTPHAVFCLSSDDLQVLTNGEVISLNKIVS